MIDNDEVYSLLIDNLEDRIEKWRNTIKSDREFEKVGKGHSVKDRISKEKIN